MPNKKSFAIDDAGDHGTIKLLWDAKVPDAVAELAGASYQSVTQSSHGAFIYRRDTITPKKGWNMYLCYVRSIVHVARKKKEIDMVRTQ